MPTHVHDLVEHPPNAELCIGEGVEDDVVLESLRPVALAQLVPRFTVPGALNKLPDAILQRSEVAVRLGLTPGLERVDSDADQVGLGRVVFDELPSHSQKLTPRACGPRA